LKIPYVTSLTYNFAYYFAVLAGKSSVSNNAIAAAWILRHPTKLQVIAGTVNPAHFRDTVDGTKFKLTAQEWYNVYLATILLIAVPNAGVLGQGALGLFTN